MYWLFLLFPLVRSDVLRTVFCSRQCNDYLSLPETEIGACTPSMLKYKECGTVITCDWSEAQKEKLRPTANETDLCCYRTVIKEKGDCDTHDVEPKSSIASTVPNLIGSVPNEHLLTSTICEHWGIGWLLAILFAFISIAEAGYIVFTCLWRPAVQKVYTDQFEHARPLYTARPLIDTRLI